MILYNSYFRIENAKIVFNKTTHDYNLKGIVNGAKTSFIIRYTGKGLPFFIANKNRERIYLNDLTKISS